MDSKAYVDCPHQRRNDSLVVEETSYGKDTILHDGVRKCPSGNFHREIQPFPVMSTAASEIDYGHSTSQNVTSRGFGDPTIGSDSSNFLTEDKWIFKTPEKLDWEAMFLEALRSEPSSRMSKQLEK